MRSRPSRSWARAGSKAEGGEGKRESLFFLFRFFKAIFKLILNPFEFVSKTRQYRKTIAAACMNKHVSSLIVDFNLIKKYYLPYV